MKTCLRSWIGAKKNILVNFGQSGPFRTPEWIPLGVLILFYHSILLPLHKISFELIKMCCLSEWIGGKYKIFKILVNFSFFWPFGTPLLGPQGSSFSSFIFY